MTSIENYKRVFVDSLSLTNSKDIEKLEYNIIPEWDSIGHMSLIAALEEEYKISLETDDIIDFSSYTVGMDILSKYNIKF